MNGFEVLSDCKYGYLDRTGCLVIAGGYDLAQPFSEGLAVVQIGDGMLHARYGYINVNGKEIIPLTLTSATAFKDGLRWCGDAEGDGEASTSSSTVLDELWRSCRHQRVEPFSEGLAAASLGEEFGFIDIEGRWVVEPQFDQVESFKDGLAEVQRGDWFGLIDRAGHFVWGPVAEGTLVRVMESEWAS